MLTNYFAADGQAQPAAAGLVSHVRFKRLVENDGGEAGPVVRQFKFKPGLLIVLACTACDPYCHRSGSVCFLACFLGVANQIVKHLSQAPAVRRQSSRPGA